MAKKIVTFSTILKRSRCLNSSSNNVSNVDMSNAYKLLNSQLNNPREISGRISSSLEAALSSFLTGICDIDNANMYYRQVMYFIQEFNNIDIKISNYILKEYVNNILPYVEDLSGMTETVTRYDLLDNQVNEILEASSCYIISDRILKNHNIISKKFNIEDFKNHYFELKDRVEYICSLIDTFNVKSYQKLNIAIEELIYLLGKYNIEYLYEDIVKYSLEYFLLRDTELSSTDIKGYKIALQDSHCLPEESLNKVSYLFKECNGEYSNIDNKIGKFLISPNKNSDVLFTYMEDIINSTSFIGLQFGINRIVSFLFDVYKSDLYEEENLLNLYEKIFNGIISKLASYIDSANIDREILEIILSNTIKAKESITVNRNYGYDYISKASKYKSLIDKFIVSLNYIISITYPSSNIDAMRNVNINDESTEIIPLKEFKVFKFHNLVNAAINLDKYMKEKGKKTNKKISNKIKNGISKIKSILFNESDMSIYSYIGEDHKADICIAQIYLDESEIEDAHKFLNETCKEFNNKLLIENKDTIKAYYIINPGIAEVHVKESACIELTEDDLSMISKSEFPELETYIDGIATLQTCCEIYDSLDENQITSIKEKVSEFVNNPEFTLEHFDVALEALSLLNVSKEDIKIFAEQFSDYRYKAILESGGTDSYLNESKKIDSMTANWVKEDNVPIDIQLEAYQALCAVLEAKPDLKKPELKKPDNKKPNTDKKENDTENNKGIMDKFRNKSKDVKDDTSSKLNKDKDNKDGEDKKKKNPFSGVNLNSIKLYLEGLKSKMKNMSQKEKEASRNLDNWFRRFSKSLHDAMISDRREAIIKGSVIPSFSKCIKIAIGLAGLGIVTGSPVVPILTAFAGFAVSKNLTKKERILMLDEIETELQVVEKEISIAESKNQMKKYRALLTYKKDLQRQYQRIKYNVRVGKDILPNSTAGLRNND